MKVLFFWTIILAMSIGLPATHAAIAKPNNANKIVAPQQPDKLRTQPQEKSVAERRKLTITAPKTSKSIRTDTRTKKSSSSINGTMIHRKH